MEGLVLYQQRRYTNLLGVRKLIVSVGITCWKRCIETKQKIA